MTNTTDTNTNTDNTTTTNTTEANTMNTNTNNTQIIKVTMFNRSCVFSTFDHEGERAMLFTYIDADGNEHTKACTYKRIAEACDYMFNQCIKAFNWTKDKVMALIEYMKEKFSKKEETTTK